MAELTDDRKATMYLVVEQCAQRSGYRVDSYMSSNATGRCLAVHGVVDPVAFGYEVGYGVGAAGSAIDENIGWGQIFGQGYVVFWPDLPALSDK